MDGGRNALPSTNRRNRRASKSYDRIRNPLPNRERQHPRTWVVYSSGRGTVKVHVVYSGSGSPQVVDKKAV